MNRWEDVSGFSGRIQDSDYSVGDPLHILIDEYKNVIIRWPESIRIKAGGYKIFFILLENLSGLWREDSRL
jgi:hypothetical protein